MNCTFHKVPDDMLLNIFSYLPHKEVAKCSRVCRRWYFLSPHPQIWKNTIFISPHNISTKQVHRFVSSVFSCNVESLTLEGFITKNNSNSVHVLSKTVLDVIRKRMPKLKYLRIENANISNIDIGMFPSSLRTLSIHFCIVDREFLEVSASRIDRLTTLDLSYVHTLYNLTSINKLANLTEINVSHCINLSKNIILCLANNLNMLKRVNISNMLFVDDEILLAFARNILLEMLMASFTSIKNTGIIEMCSCGVPNLKFIDIRGCFYLTGDILEIIAVKTKIEKLHIFRNMKKWADARKEPPIRNIQILDEVDTGAYALPFTIDRIKQMGKFPD